jgi:uncharacterized protein YjbJ (UPF0337 family)
MADPDRVEGAGQKMGGKVKEGVGKLTGDEKLKREGQADQIGGTVKNAIGGAKDALRDESRKH